jgi:hypothetical protein
VTERLHCKAKEICSCIDALDVGRRSVDVEWYVYVVKQDLWPIEDFG